MNNDILPLFQPQSRGRPVAKAMSGCLLATLVVGLLPAPSAAADEQVAISAVDDRANWVQFPPPKPKPVQADRDSVTPKPAEAAKPAEAPKANDAAKAAAPAPAPKAAEKPTPAPQTAVETPAPKPAEAAKPVEAPAVANKPAEAPVGIELVGFVFVGNQAISSTELGQALAGQLGLKSNMAEFEKITEEVTRYYRQRGWLARADLPQQELSGGILRVNITEAKFGGTVIDDPSGALKASDHLVKLIERRQPVGQTVNLPALESASLLAAEVPGVKTQISLQPGANAGESVALVQVMRSKEKEVQVDLDNHGSRAVGAFRQSVAFNLNNPSQRGDQIAVNLLNSEGVKYGRLMYSLPLAGSGWRLSSYASAMHYQLVSSDFAALQAEGPSSTLGLALNLPLVRTPVQTLNLNIAAEMKRYRNDVLNQTVTKYSGQSTNFSLDFSGHDPLSPWHYRSTASLVVGKIDLSDSTASHIQGDQATAQTAGDYQRFRFSHHQRYALNERQALVGQFQTQWASKNLDGAEKLYLGGAQGVRAYPANEAGGSQANVVNLEYQQLLPVAGQNMTVAGFYDWGDVTVNKFSSFTTALNHYQLEGWGLWLGSSVNSGLGQTDFKLTWARRIGHNPNANSSGLDQDGSLVLNRYLFNINHAF